MENNENYRSRNYLKYNSSAEMRENILGYSTQIWLGGPLRVFVLGREKVSTHTLSQTLRHFILKKLGEESLYELVSLYLNY